MLPEEKVAERLREWANGEPCAVEHIRQAADMLEHNVLEINRLKAVCVMAHDRLLRGDSDKELIDLLQTAWRVPNVKLRGAALLRRPTRTQG